MKWHKYLSLASRWWARFQLLWQEALISCIILQKFSGIWFPSICVHLLGFLALIMHRLWNSQTLQPVPLYCLYCYLMWHSTCTDSSNWCMFSGFTAIQGWPLCGLSWSSPVLTYLIGLAHQQIICMPAVSLHTLSKHLWIQVCFSPSATKNSMIACF